MPKQSGHKQKINPLAAIEPDLAYLDSFNSRHFSGH
jgi:hypothetical protein